MKNLLIKTAWAWGLLLCLMFSCSDSLEDRIIEENNFQEPLEQNVELNEEGVLKKKGKGKGKKDEDSDDEDSDDEDSDDEDSEEGVNQGKSEENKGKGKDKDAQDEDSEDDAPEDSDSEERGNQGKSEENKGKGKDKDAQDEDSEEDNSSDQNESENEMQADYRTQTIGGWGSRPRGNNPGSYLHQNFETAFPNGITIGAGEITVQFTSAQAITDYLPAGGKANSIGENYVDPSTKELKNNFVSQLLAATITTGLDVAITDFSKSEIVFSRLEIADGELAGLLVNQILEEANKVLAGQESDFTISQLHEALKNINESFVDGKSSSGYLKS